MALQHIEWLIELEDSLRTACGKQVRVYEFRYVKDDGALSEWARHFRNHYCLDTEIDALRATRSRKQYLEEIKFPGETSQLGPGVRAGDFAEILVSDYLEWKLGFWVPRFRWRDKVVRDESSKGCDVVGFQFAMKGTSSARDVLATFESKAALTKSNENRLQDAVAGSARDKLRIDESLNFLKQQMLNRHLLDDVKRIERFQSPVDNPYRSVFGAAAVLTNESFDEKIICTTDSGRATKTKDPKVFLPHPRQDELTMIVIRGNDLMTLVHDLYALAANEA